MIKIKFYQETVINEVSSKDSSIIELPDAATPEQIAAAIKEAKFTLNVSFGQHGEATEKSGS